MTERFISLSKFTGESVDILERLAQELIMMDQEAFDINKLPLTEEYKKNQEEKKRKVEDKRTIKDKRRNKKHLVIDNDRRMSYYTR